MITLKEQWLILTPNIDSLQVVPIQKLDLKQKEKTSRASEHREDRFVEFAEEHKLIIANTLFQKPTDTELGNRETRNQNRFSIE